MVTRTYRVALSSSAHIFVLAYFTVKDVLIVLINSVLDVKIVLINSVVDVKIVLINSVLRLLLCSAPYPRPKKRQTR